MIYSFQNGHVFSSLRPILLIHKSHHLGQSMQAKLSRLSIGSCKFYLVDLARMRGDVESYMEDANENLNNTKKIHHCFNGCSS